MWCCWWRISQLNHPAGHKAFFFFPLTYENESLLQPWWGTCNPALLLLSVVVLPSLPCQPVKLPKQAPEGSTEYCVSSWACCLGSLGCPLGWEPLRRTLSSCPFPLQAQARGGRCVPVVCDSSQESEVRSLFEQVNREQHGRLDVLVNNAYAGVQVPLNFDPNSTFQTSPLTQSPGHQAHYAPLSACLPLHTFLPSDSCS